MYNVQQNISYQSFMREQRIKLSLKYPFLSKSQINGKVKELWNKLAQEEKQQYTKTSLIKTPTKNVKRQSKPKGKTGKWTCFNTPELLFEERDNGELDFADSSKTPRSSTDKEASQSKHTEDSDWFYDDSWERIVRNKSKESPEEETRNSCLTNTGGILKNTSSLKDTTVKSKANRVSFSHEPADEHEISEATQPSQDCSNSDDEDALLICRTDIDFDDIDDHKIEVEKDGTVPAVSFRTEREPNTDKFSEPDAKHIAGDNERGPDEVLKLTTGKQGKKEDTDQISENVEMKSNHEKITDKKPKVGKRKTRKGKNKIEFSKAENKQAKGRLRSPVLKDEKKSSENTRSKVTPLVKIDAHQSVTPMMNETTLQQNLAEVSKAPRKRRSVTEGTLGNDDVSIKDVKGQVKKSRLSLKNLSINGERDLQTDIEQSKDDNICRTNAAGDATQSGKRDKNKDSVKKSAVKCKQKRQSRKINSMQSENWKVDADSNKNEPTNYDSSMSFDYEAEDNIIPNSLSSNGEEESAPALSKSAANRALRKVLSMMRNTVASPCSPNASLTDRSEELLSPALSGISTLSSLSSEPGVIAASPFMEELPQHRNKESRKDIAIKSPSVTTTVCQSELDKEVHKETRPPKTKEEGSLCEMFQNITPPEKKVHKKKSRRLLASATEKGPSIFSDWLNEADIFS